MLASSSRCRDMVSQVWDLLPKWLSYSCNSVKALIRVRGQVEAVVVWKLVSRDEFIDEILEG